MDDGDQYVPDTSEAPPPPPEGFTPHSDGLYWHPAQRIFWQAASQKFFCFDEARNFFSELQQEASIEDDLRLIADSSCLHRVEGLREGRHVVVRDLAKAASSLRMPIDHLARPLALFEIFDSRRPPPAAVREQGAEQPASDAAAAPVGTSAAPTTPAAAPRCVEYCARNLHLKLLKRLSEFKGPWGDFQLKNALRGACEDLDAEILAKAGDAPDGCSAALALLTGRRLFLANVGDVIGILGAVDSEGRLESLRQNVRPVPGPEAVQPVVLPTPDVSLVELEQRHLFLLLANGGIASALSEADMAEVARQRIGRPRLTSGALVQAAQERGASTSLFALCVYFDWKASAQPPAKRPRVDAALAPAKPSQVRCRHILVKHRDCRDPVDKARTHKPVSRSLADAERILRAAIEAIEGSPSQNVFTQRCKAVSECDTCLKGGEMAGDLGWISRGRVHSALEAAAFSLPVGHISDIIESDEGVHLLWRIA